VDRYRSDRRRTTESRLSFPNPFWVTQPCAPFPAPCGKQRMTRLTTINELRTAPPIVLPSMLLCDFGRLHDEVKQLEAAGARALHLDVMDGNFVPNLTYGMPIVEAIREATDLPLDVHLMVARPQDYVDAFADAGASTMTIHVEAVDDPRSVLEKIRERDVVSGLALNPPTPLEAIAPSLPYCDMVLCMSVMPGFGGQKFDPVALKKLASLRQQRGDSLLLEVDGGVNETTIAECTRAGAQLLVTGAAVFRSGAPYAESLATLGELAAA
jgi:ribulose-phosphate 3-epimerase